MTNHLISIVIPVYNEERYIENCIDSLLLQDYPREYMEWIFVDGMSTDKTKERIHKYAQNFPLLIKVLDNPNKTVPYAMNIGIANAKGTYIIRLDAHAEYSTDYISKCAYYLDTTDADNVGGVAETKGWGFVGNGIAKMLSTQFGVGNSEFRTNGESGYVDTVPFGAFRREVFEKWGGYDVRLTRNQDNEMNYRIRKNGGKIYLANDIRFSYYCRDSVSGICDMALKNGMWNIITMKLCPGAMGIRHFVPFVFVLSLMLLPLLSVVYSLFGWLLFVELLLYFGLDCVFSAQKASSVREFLLLILLFPLFHICYGFGSMRGVAKLFPKDFK